MLWARGQGSCGGGCEPGATPSGGEDSVTDRSGSVTTDMSRLCTCSLSVPSVHEQTCRKPGGSPSQASPLVSIGEVWARQ